MNDSDIAAYTARFSGVAMLCSRMVTAESKKVERYIWGLSPQIRENMIVVNPSTFDSVKRLAQTLVDHGVRQGFMTAIPEQPKECGNKKKFWNKWKGRSSQEPTKKQQTAAIHIAIVPAIVHVSPTPPNRYVGTLSKCNKCNFHHTGVFQEMHCKNYNKKGHTTRFCKAPAQPITQVPGNGVSQA